MDELTLEEKLKIASIRHLLLEILSLNLSNMTPKDAYAFLEKIQKEFIDIINS